MRIIGGKFKGKRFSPPKGLPVRPTTDFAKEALFNIISHSTSFEQLHVLDLFSGTGNVAFEFLSRGCASLVAVDNHFKCVKYIKQVLNELQCDNATAIKANVFPFIKSHKDKYDIVFADPPYDMENKQRVVDLIFDKELLNADGRLILEHPKQDQFNSNEHYLETRKYNRVNFSIFGYGAK